MQNRCYVYVTLFSEIEAKLALVHYKTFPISNLFAQTNKPFMNGREKTPHL